MSDITWSNKVDNQVSPLPAEKKVTAADMNQIKTAVNSKANEDASNVDSRTEWRNRLYAANTITMSGNLTLTETTQRVLYLNPNGADRTVDVSNIEGLPVFISHAGGANTIDVGGLVTLFAGDTVSVLSNGTSAVVEGHTVAEYTIAIYEEEGSYDVNTSVSVITLNGNDIELTLPRPGKWRVHGSFVAIGDDLTSGGEILSVFVIQDGNGQVKIPLVGLTNSDQLITASSLPPVYIDTGSSGSTVNLGAHISATPSNGGVKIIAASLVAERVGP